MFLYDAYFCGIHGFKNAVDQTEDVDSHILFRVSDIYSIWVGKYIYEECFVCKCCTNNGQVSDIKPDNDVVNYSVH